MKKEKNKFNIIRYIFVSMAFFVAISVFASEYTFDTQNKEVSVGQKFQVDLNINTNKENINAVEGKVVFNTDILELSEIRGGNSIVNFWIDKPFYKDGGIVFSGITPGGYTLNKGLILSIIFIAKKEGNTFINIENGLALKNDGNGTKSILKTSNLQLNILSTSTIIENTNLDITDKESPDTFQPEVSKDPNLLDNKWFVVFVAQDKLSGIDKYEIKESKYNIFNFSKWVSAESPYVLKDQDLRSNIYIKAIDKAGNIRVVKLPPNNPLSWYANIENWFIIVLVIIVVFTYFFFKKKFKKQ